MTRISISVVAAAALASTVRSAPHGCHHGAVHDHDLGGHLGHEQTEQGFEALLQRYPDLATRFPGLVSPFPSAQVTFAQSLEGSVYVPCVPGYVEPFAGWYAGDTHNHIQTCDIEVIGVDDLHADMVERRLDVTTPLLWGPDISGDATWSISDPVTFQEKYVLPYITGEEDPYTADLPEMVQFGIEVSGFTAGHWGHLTALNIGLEGTGIHWNSGGPEGFVWTAPYTGFGFGFTSYTRDLECGATPTASDGFKDDGTGFWSVPVLDEFKKSEGALVGYAHQAWPTGLYLDPSEGGWDWEFAAQFGLETPIGADMKCGDAYGRNAAFPNNFEGGTNFIYPVLMPMDVALRQVDFLEAWDLQRDETGAIDDSELCVEGDPFSRYIPCGVEQPWSPSIPDRWHGAYYKLLSAGQRVSVSGGTDANCAAQLCFPRTHVQLEETESPSYQAWIKNLQAGRVVVATEAYHFLEVTVNGEAPGSQLELESTSGSTEVEVDFTYALDPAALAFFLSLDATLPGSSADALTLELVSDGGVVDAVTLTPEQVADGAPHSGSFSFELERSGWLAVRTRTETIHTGAFFAIVDGKPIANCSEAEYWTLYCDYVLAKIEGYARCAEPGGVVPGETHPEFLEEHVGLQRADIEQHVREARKIFAAVRDYDTEITGVQHLHRSSPAVCSSNLGNVTELPMGAGVNDTPRVNAPLTVHCFNAPPGAKGWILVKDQSGFISDPAGVQVLSGADLFLVDPFSLPVEGGANDGGYAEVRVTSSIPLYGIGVPFYFQFLWENPEPCDYGGTYSASDVLCIVPQAPGA